MSFLDVVCRLCLAALLAVAPLCLYRIARGPTAADRAIAFDLLAMIFLVIICVLSVAWGSSLYFDAVWILTLVGFLGTVSLARFLESGRVI